MKPYRIHILLFALVLSLVTPGCKKFLEKDPQGLLTTDQFPTSASDALLATNAFMNPPGIVLSFRRYPILDIMSDDARKGSNPSDQEAPSVRMTDLRLPRHRTDLIVGGQAFMWCQARKCSN